MENRGNFRIKLFAIVIGSMLIGWVAFLGVTRSQKETLQSSSSMESPESASTPQAQTFAMSLTEQDLSGASASLEESPELKKRSEAVRKSLPDPAIFKGRSAEEVHHTPPEILEAGRKLGALAEYLESHPAEIPAALPTYIDCALNTKTMESIRALCAYRLKVYSSHWDERTRSAYAKVPESIRNLASKLNSN